MWRDWTIVLTKQTRIFVYFVKCFGFPAIPSFPHNSNHLFFLSPHISYIFFELYFRVFCSHIITFHLWGLMCPLVEIITHQPWLSLWFRLSEHMSSHYNSFIWRCSTLWTFVLYVLEVNDLLKSKKEPHICLTAITLNVITIYMLYITHIITPSIIKTSLKQ